jgi:hypothetical protein
MLKRVQYDPIALIAIWVTFPEFLTLYLTNGILKLETMKPTGHLKEQNYDKENFRAPVKKVS